MLDDYCKENEIEVGMDESGAGPMSGDLFLAGVILPSKCPDEESQKYWDMLNDSKKLSDKKRNLLYDFILKIAKNYSIVRITPEQIDQDNIWNSRINGFHNVIDKLTLKPTHIIVDGKAFKPYGEIPYKCFNKGDTKFKSIAAASILAKVSRDRVMIKLHEEYPLYNWKKNKGYGTKEHLNAIQQYGITKYHRKTYGLCKEWNTLPKKFLT